MAAPDRQSQPTIHESEQVIQNQSFDKKYNVLAVELLAENAAGDALMRLKANSAGSLVSGLDYDYVDIQQTNATTDTYVFKTGGSGGTTVRTVVVTYTSSAKTDIDTVEYS